MEHLRVAGLIAGAVVQETPKLLLRVFLILHLGACPGNA